MPTVAELSIEVDVKDFGAQEDILRLQQMLQRLATEDPDISVRVNAEAARREFDRLKEEIVWLEGNTVSIETEADARVAIAKLEELQRKMRELDRSTIGVDVDIDTTGALLHLAVLREELRSISRERVEVDRDQSAFKSLNQISAAAQRASGTIRGLTTAVIALGPALVPITAVAATGLLGLSAGFAAAAAGAGVFGAVAVTVFTPVADVIKKMKTAQDAYNQAATDKQRDTALAKLKALYDSMDPAQQKLVKSFFAMRDAWKEFANQFRPELFQMATEAMSAFTAFIPSLTPLMTNATKAIHQLQTEAIQTFQNPVWKEFFQNLTNSAGPAILSLGRSIMNLATGFAGVLNAFFPFQKGLLGGLEELTKKFADWGATLKDNAGFRSFIEYVKEATPKVINSLGSLAKAFVALVVAAAPVGEIVLDVLTKVFDTISKIGDISPTLLTVGIIFAGLSAIFVNMIGPILAVVNVVNLLLPLFSLMGTALGLAKIAVVGFLSSWGLIIVAVAAVAAALVLAYKNFDGFRAKVDEFAQRLMDIGKNIIDAVGPAISEFVKFFQDEWGKFLSWWNENSGTFSAAWDNIKSVVEGALNWVVDEISGALDQIVSVWNAVWPGLSTILSGVWTAIKGIVSGAFQVIRGIFTVFAAIIAGDWSKIWDGLGDIVFGAMNIVGSIISGAIQVIIGALQLLGAGVSAAWNAIVTAFQNGINLSIGFLQSTWSGIVAVFNGALDGIVSGAQNFVNVIVGFFQWLYDVLVGHSIVPDMVNAILGWFTTLYTSAMAILQPLIDFVVSIFQGMFDFASSIFSNLSTIVTASMQAISTVITTVLSAISATWSAVWNAISSIATTIWNTIKTLISAAIQAVQAVITATMQAIQGNWSGAWNTISSTASSIWNTIKSAISSAISSVSSTISSTMNTIKGIWTTAWNNVVSALKTAASSIAGAVSGIVSSITSAFTGLVSKAFSWGKNIIGGLIDGIKSMASSAKDAVKGVVSNIASVMPGSPAKEGPLSGHGYVKLRGQRFIQDLATGLRETSALRMTMKDVADLMALNVSPEAAFNAIATPSAPNAGAFLAGAAGTGSSTVLNVSSGAIVLQIPAGMDPKEARAAFDGAQDTMAEALLTAIQKR